MLKVFHDRGSAGTSELNSYSKNGTLESHGNLISLTSLDWLMSEHQDFLDEKQHYNVIERIYEHQLT